MVKQAEAYRSLSTDYSQLSAENARVREHAEKVKKGEFLQKKSTLNQNSHSTIKPILTITLASTQAAFLLPLKRFENSVHE